MIHKMREMAPMIMLIILVAFVGGTIFLDWGMNAGNRGGARSVSAGKINGKDVPLNYFDREVNLERQKLQQEKGDIPDYQSRMIPQQVWEREVNRVLMQDVFHKMDLGASADEVFEFIKRNPLPGIDTVSAFQTNGSFDTSKYVQFLNDPQNYETYGWLRDVENYYKDMIIPGSKLQQLLEAGVFPSKAEVEYQYRQDNQRSVFEYAKISSSALPVDASKITEEMMKKYYETHRDTFTSGEQADLYYVKYPKVATENDAKTYLQEMKDLKSRIETSGKPIAEAFADEAKVESDDDGSAVNGGDLGWFGKGQMVPQFDSVAFSMDTGKISDPVRTQFGYHLILVEGKEEKDGQVKVKARHILRKNVPTQETLDSLAEKADSLRGEMLSKGFIAAAKAMPGVKVDSTGLYKKGDPIPEIGYVSGIGRYVFGNDKKDKVSERLENENGYYIVSVKRKLNKGVMPFDAVKDRIRKTLADSIRSEEAKVCADSLLKTLGSGTALTVLKGTDPKITAGVTDTISGSNYIPDIGYDSKVTAVANALPQGKLSKPFEYNGNYYIVRPLWKSTVEPLKWGSPEANAEIEKMQMQQKQKIYFDWYSEYKNSSKVKSNIDNIYLD